MKRLSLFVLLAFALFNCKKDAPSPVPGLESIVGKWRPVEYKKADGTVVPVTNGDADFMEFRYDGVILNKRGYRPCCSPGSYKVNGVLFEIKPQAAVELDPMCGTVDCFTCPDLRITQVSPNEIVTYCGQNSTKFVRK